MQRPQEYISSRQNPTVMLTASLAERKYRNRHGLFRIDGKKLLIEALDAAMSPVAVLLRESSAQALCEEIGDRTLPADCRGAVLSDAVFDRLSEEHSPEGVIAVCRKPASLHLSVAGEADLLAGVPEGRVFMLESVRDPGNLGTAIRSARAFGVDTLILSADCADLYHPRVLRAAMGTLFSQRVVIAEDFPAAVRAMRSRGRVLAAALDREAVRLDALDKRANDVIIVGNEGHGISPQTLAAADACIFIPMACGVESLNAGVAASVLMWELAHG